jgi:hypothetical protein
MYVNKQRSRLTPNQHSTIKHFESFISPLLRHRRILRKPRIFALIMTLYLLQVGCTPTLESWVKSRDYLFYNDYSTISPLGWEVKGNGQPKNAPNLKVMMMQIGQIPDYEMSSEFNVKIEGKAETEKILKNLFSGELKGNFDNVETVELAISNPKKELGTWFAFRGPCPDKKLKVINRVLKTGDMTVRLKDKNENNVSGTFNLEGIHDSISLSLNSYRFTSSEGKDFYIGFSTQEFNCEIIYETNDLSIPRGKQINYGAGAVDFYYTHYYEADHENKIDLPFAEVYVIPSGFLERTGQTTELANARSELNQLVAENIVSKKIEPLVAAIEESRNLRSQVALLEAKIKEQQQASEKLNSEFQMLVMEAEGGLKNPHDYDYMVKMVNPYTYGQRSISLRPLRLKQLNPSQKVKSFKSNKFSSENPLGEYPDREWERVYHDQYRYDSSFSWEPKVPFDAEKVKKINKDYSDLQENEKQNISALQNAIDVGSVNTVKSLLSEQKRISSNKNRLIAELSQGDWTNIKREGKYLLEFGKHLDIPGSLPSSNVYLEIKEVNKDEIKIRLRHVVLSTTN